VRTTRQTAFARAWGSLARISAILGATVAFGLIAGNAWGQAIQGCQNQDGTGCKYFGGIFGGSCVPPRVVVLACPDAPTPTPVPSATPTPTPAPAEPQPTYTVTEFLTPADVPVRPGMASKTYLQAMRLFKGAVLVGNVGVCCPGIGTPGQGEAIFTIDGRVSPPQYREWWETFTDSCELWESGCSQITESDMYPFGFVGCLSRRPSVAALQDDWKGSQVWAFGVPQLDTPHWSFPWNLGIIDIEADADVWPQAILDLDGQRWLIVQYARRTGEFGLARLLWPSVGRVAMWVSGSVLTTDPSLPLFSGIAVDADGSWIATSGWWPAQTNSAVFVWRSRDAGQTWANTGIRFEYAGHDMFGCGPAQNGHGAADVPWRFTCTSATGGSGPTDGSWHGTLILTNGAAMPANLMTKPVRWTPAPTPSGP
jgi:hypothetical protein